MLSIACFAAAAGMLDKSIGFFGMQRLGDANDAYLQDAFDRSLTDSTNHSSRGDAPMHQPSTHSRHTLLHRIAAFILIPIPTCLSIYPSYADEGQASSNKASAAIQFWQAQMDYLSQDHDFSKKLGKKAIVLTHAELLRKGYECYWKRQLEDAKQIFYKVMQLKYGNFKDWLYMLPSLLPIKAYVLLVNSVDRLQK
jgi:hypothetical protein